jgi:exonuclease III
MLYDKFDSCDIICITETWLSDSTTNAMLDPHNHFYIFRRDRCTTTIGGGVCIFVRKCVRVVEVELLPSFGLIECVCIDIFCNINSTIRLFTIYRTGGTSDNHANVMNRLINCLHSLCIDTRTCVITGDLNCPLIDWSRSIICTDPLQKRFLDIVDELGFLQYVNEPLGKGTLWI